MAGCFESLCAGRRMATRADMTRMMSDELEMGMVARFMRVYGGLCLHPGCYPGCYYYPLRLGSTAEADI